MWIVVGKDFAGDRGRYNRGGKEKLQRDL